MEFTNEMIMTVTAIVTAYVAVFRKFNIIDTRFLPFVALAIGLYFVLIPIDWYTKSVTVSIIGLTSSGVYQMTKSKSESNESK